jgi:putative aminopeptidase FrvX
MRRDTLLALTRSILSQPTAPFNEEQVAAEICRQLAKCPHVSVQRDRFGNIIAGYRRGRKKPRWAFAAHMDHPGWVRSKSGGRKFLGGVPAPYHAKPKIREFGAFAMWDLPAFEMREGKIYSRACDDLIGCAAIVVMFHELERTSAQCSCLGIFTRAEEVGFVGAIKLAQSRLLPKSITIISIETSAERPWAKIGAGPIIRVGDRRSLFDPNATAELVEIAARGKISAQRALMDGGTCEATAYQLYGYRTAALAIALGNYHNCLPPKKTRRKKRGNRIGSEYVAFDDLIALVKLCAQITKTAPTRDPQEVLRKKLEANLRKTLHT